MYLTGISKPLLWHLTGLHPPVPTDRFWTAGTGLRLFLCNPEIPRALEVGKNTCCLFVCQTRLSRQSPLFFLTLLSFLFLPSLSPSLLLETELRTFYKLDKYSLHHYITELYPRVLSALCVNLCMYVVHVPVCSYGCRGQCFTSQLLPALFFETKLSSNLGLISYANITSQQVSRILQLPSTGVKAFISSHTFMMQRTLMC